MPAEYQRLRTAADAAELGADQHVVCAGGRQRLVPDLAATGGGDPESAR